jgi:hypothetical protein
MPVQINGLPLMGRRDIRHNNGEKFIVVCHVYLLVFARLVEKTD